MISDKKPEAPKSEKAPNKKPAEEIAETNAANKDQNDAEASSKKGAIALLIVIISLLVYHLISDRLTPYTQQARVYANIVAIAPEVGGKVEQVLITDNQNVDKDAPLLEIDDPQYEIAVEKATADLTATKRELEAADAAIEMAESNLAVAEAELERAQKESERHERLYKKDKGAISLRRVEVSRANFKKAQSGVEASKAQVAQAKQARGSLNEDNDRLQAAQSAVEKAKLDLERTKLRAPGNGLITNLAIDKGQFASPGKPIMTFIAIHDVWISADMTENNLGHIVVGDKAQVVFDIMPGRVFDAKVRSISYGVNTKKEPTPGQLSSIENSNDFLRQAQRFPVIIEITEADREDLKNLKIGGQADVIVYTQSGFITNWIGRIYIRAMSLFSFLY